MSTVKVIYDKNKTRSSGDNPVILRFRKSGLKKEILILNLPPDKWNFKTNQPRSPRLANIIEKQYIKAQVIVLQHGHLPLDTIVQMYKNNAEDSHNFFQFADNYMQELKESGAESNASSFTAALNQFKSFIRIIYSKDDISFAQIDYALLDKFKRYKLQSVSSNTFITYLSKIRAIYNRAVDLKLISRDNYPFNKKLFPKAQKTAKRDIDIDLIKRIENRAREKNNLKQLAKDLYLFGFYMRGMDLIDIAQIKVSDFVGKKHYQYRRTKNRNKSGDILIVKITGKALEVADKYIGNNTFVFPVLLRDDLYSEKGFNSYNHRRDLINRYLIEIGKEENCSIKLTSKTNRHTFATRAKYSGTPYAFIQEMMGHSNNNVTDIYLNKFPQQEIDEYHEKIINFE